MGKERFRSINRAFRRGRLRLVWNTITEQADLYRVARGNQKKRVNRTGKSAVGHLGKRFMSPSPSIPTTADNGKHWIPA